MNKETLIKEIDKLGINLNDQQVNTIEAFCLFLLEENKKYNLTAIRNLEDVYLKHVLDSLTIVKAILNIDNQSVLDIGSGAGFPGIILQVAYPNLKITLLDSNGKKTSFLKMAKEKFMLNNLTVINARAEEYITKNREKFDIVTARAVANINVLAELAIPYLKIDGLFIAMKADLASDNIQNKDLGGFILGSKLEKVDDFLLPIEESKRSLLTFVKKEKTSEKFPRRYDQIIKKTLKICRK